MSVKNLYVVQDLFAICSSFVVSLPAHISTSVGLQVNKIIIILSPCEAAFHVTMVWYGNVYVLRAGSHTVPTQLKPLEYDYPE